MILVTIPFVTESPKTCWQEHVRWGRHVWRLTFHFLCRHATSRTCLLLIRPVVTNKTILGQNTRRFIIRACIPPYLSVQLSLCKLCCYQNTHNFIAIRAERCAFSFLCTYWHLEICIWGHWDLCTLCALCLFSSNVTQCHVPHGMSYKCHKCHNMPHECRTLSYTCVRCHKMASSSKGNTSWTASSKCHNAI